MSSFFLLRLPQLLLFLSCFYCCRRRHNLHRHCPCCSCQCCYCCGRHRRHYLHRHCPCCSCQCCYCCCCCLLLLPAAAACCCCQVLSPSTALGAASGSSAPGGAGAPVRGDAISPLLDAAGYTHGGQNTACTHGVYRVECLTRARWVVAYTRFACIYLLYPSRQIVLRADEQFPMPHWWGLGDGW